MPTYEYQCLKCHTNFDIVQSFQEETLVKCPTKSQAQEKNIDIASCQSPGKGKVQKLFSTPAIIFKGKGFYKTDSQSSSPSGSSNSTGEASRKDSDSEKSSAALEKLESTSSESSENSSKLGSREGSRGGSGDASSSSGKDSKGKTPKTKSSKEKAPVNK